MRSLLAQGLTPFAAPAGCGLVPCRTEVTFTLRSNGRLYQFKARDKIMPEDLLFVLVKAAALAVQQGEPYNGRTPQRSLKDLLIKQNVVV